MKTKAKQVWRTGVIVGGAIAGWVGVITDGPQAIHNLLEKGPWFVSHPNFWWTVGCVAFVGISLWLIWKNPDSNEVTNDGIEHRPQDIAGQHLLHRLEMTVEHMRNAVDQKDLVKLRLIVTNLSEVEFPVLLQTVSSKADRTKFEKMLAEIKNRSYENQTLELLAIYSATMTYVLSFLCIRFGTAIGGYMPSQAN